jgi:tRNA U34 5-carboxymethylaminomethyl modifying GTPase MnmE/TrmE
MNEASHFPSILDMHIPMKPYYDPTPIIAIATAPGRGGIGVVRLSGKDLQPIMRALFGHTVLTPRRWQCD